MSAQEARDLEQESKVLSLAAWLRLIGAAGALWGFFFHIVPRPSMMTHGPGPVLMGRLYGVWWLIGGLSVHGVGVKLAQFKDSARWLAGALAWGGASLLAAGAVFLVVTGRMNLSRFLYVAGFGVQAWTILRAVRADLSGDAADLVFREEYSRDETTPAVADGAFRRTGLITMVLFIAAEAARVLP
jgi:hypothetical protein